MALKRRSKLLEDTPAAFSEEEEVESEESEEEEEERAAKGGDESDESHKTSDTNRTSTPPIVKLANIKSVVKSTAPSKPSTSATKRPLESKKSEKEKDSKRKKKKVGVDASAGAGVADGDHEDGSPPEEDGKKPTGNEKDPPHKVGRVWSEDDEIVILNGMIGFLQKGINPASSLDQFLQSIRKSIHVDATKDQLSNKIRRLKSRYMNSIKRVEPGQDPVFAKPHDIRCYLIMKEIWGGNNSKKKGGKGNKYGNDDSNGKKRNRTPNTRSTGGVSTRGETVSPTDISSKELPEWRKLHVAELEVFVKRLELAKEQTMEVLEAFKSSLDL